MQGRGYSSVPVFGLQQPQSTSRGSQQPPSTSSRSQQPPSTSSRSQQPQSTSSGSQQPGGAQTAVSPAIPHWQIPPAQGYRHIYLVSQCYQPGRSHWFMWIPSLQNPLIGRVIHIIGSTMQGFVVQIKDNHNASYSKQYNQFVPLGQVPARLVVDAYVPHVGNVIYREEGDARDDYDIAAYALDPPRRDSYRQEPPNDPIWNMPHPRFERCQEWTRRLIADLVTDRKLPANATQIMDTAISYTDARGTRYAYSHFAPPWGT
ncbi:hypothetical protein EXIGLDRAFT_229867 [Exidia glandulosa HHB12029]|uniref:Uncharacterized protein n=1 Tax=Exidia glandulosa HHB12029 TaxID=1314781 RepID=A0A165ZWF5_EXIGL|nr:hypothetical protein EXIGLDRAFT_229867 [Exidia glandulosa HHB12029]